MDAKFSKNRILLIAFVVVMVVGLVGTYVPLLFAPPPVYKEPLPRASETIPPLASPTSTATSSPRASEAPSGFSGLNEEGQSLKNLDSLLGN